LEEGWRTEQRSVARRRRLETLDHSTKEKQVMKTLLPKVIRPRVLGLPLASMLAMTACSTTGTAVGKLDEPTGKKEAVTLLWKSDATNPDRGQISGTLPDGTHYSGKYFEVIKTAEADVYRPAWEGWTPYWSGWAYRGYIGPARELDWPTFVEIYTGRVIANMTSDDHQTRLRCRFSIDDPRAGLVGGGSGECQLSNGEAIKHVVVASN
jgi:hypothetical protein